MANGMVEQAGGMPPQGGGQPSMPQQGGGQPPMPQQGGGQPPMPPQGGMVQQGMQAEQAEELGEQASPEEQKFYDAAIQMAGEMLYNNKEGSDGILNMLNNNEQSPEMSIGDTVSLIMQQIDDAMQGKLPETVVIPAAMEITPMVADIAEEAGLITVDGEEAETRILTGTMKTLFDDFGVEEADIAELAATVPEGELQTALEQLEGMMHDSGAPMETPTPEADQPTMPTEPAGYGEE